MKKKSNEFSLKYDERGNVTSNLPLFLQGQEKQLKTFGEPNEKNVRESLNRMNDPFIYSVERTSNKFEFVVKHTNRNGGRIDNY